MDNILNEAENLIYGDRCKDYGSPLDDFSRTAKMWSGILGIDVTPQQIALCMICLKISRECNKPKRDNWIDIAGYAGTLEKLYLDIQNQLSDGAAGFVRDTITGGTG